MTTRYGTIHTTTGAESSGSDFGAIRPWKELCSLSFPTSFKDTISRIKTNISYFHTNYAILVLFVLFLSLLGRPVSLILFVILMAAWLFLYFLRDDPVVFFGCVVDERVVVVVLSIATGFFILTRATASIVAGILVGMLVVLLHAMLRMTDDFTLFNEERANNGGGDGGGVARLNLKETASSSFSTSS